MSTAVDEDVFTILTEDFEIPCDTDNEHGPAKYSAIKKCCGHTILICQVCREWMENHTVKLNAGQCMDCHAVFRLGIYFSDLFFITAL